MDAALAGAAEIADVIESHASSGIDFACQSVAGIPSPLYGRVNHALIGCMLKVVDDYLDDRVHRWVPALHPVLLVLGCFLTFAEMTRDIRISVMMFAFTIATYETGGLDRPTFYFAAATVAVAHAIAMSQNQWVASDFHMSMCMMGTAYTGILTTRLNDWVDENLGFAAKTVLRFCVGVSIYQARAFVPEDYLSMHDYLANFTIGYFAGVVLSLPQFTMRALKGGARDGDGKAKHA